MSTIAALGSIEALTAAIIADTASRDRNSDLLERIVAGQHAALEKIEAPKATRAKKTETPAEPPAQTQTPATEQQQQEPAAEQQQKAADPEVTDDDIRAAATAWMNGKSVEDRTVAAQKMGTILTHFGVGGKLTGAESVLNAEQRKQALFFIKRWGAGLEVNFSADYDFDGDPTQGAAAPADDPLG